MIRTIILFILSYLSIGVAYALFQEKTIAEACDKAWTPNHPRRNWGFAVTMVVAVIIWPLMIVGDVVAKTRKRKESE